MLCLPFLCLPCILRFYKSRGTWVPWESRFVFSKVLKNVWRLVFLWTVGHSFSKTDSYMSEILESTQAVAKFARCFYRFGSRSGKAEDSTAHRYRLPTSGPRICSLGNSFQRSIWLMQLAVAKSYQLSFVKDSEPPIDLLRAPWRAKTFTSSVGWMGNIW